MTGVETAYIDIAIPETGWERVHLDPDTQDPLMLDVLLGRAPAWLYGAVTTADEHRSDLRLHPAEYHRLVRANWTALAHIPPGGPLFGCRLVVDSAMPQGIVRITKWVDDFEPGWEFL